jgi:peptide subunit release factor RF-3
MVINIVDTSYHKDINDDFAIRRAAADSNIMLLTKIKQAELLTNALVHKGMSGLAIKPWSEYKIT